MRTVCCRSLLLWGGGLSAQGVSAWEGGVCPGDVCLPRKVFTRGCLPGGCLPRGCLPGGVCPGCLSRGVCLSGGVVCPGGGRCLLRGSAWGVYIPPVDRILDTRLWKHTFPQPPLRTFKIILLHEIMDMRGRCLWTITSNSNVPLDVKLLLHQ